VERNPSVDAVRFLAIAAIVLMHAQPFAVLAANDRDYRYLFVVLNQSARFAVPFFFVIAGYYWGLRIREGAAVLDVSARMLGRLTLAFAAWSLFYLLPLDARLPELREPARYLEFAVSKLAVLAHDPGTLLLEGTTIHLWFLPALACAILLSAALLRAGVLLPVAAVVFYLIGVAARAYGATPVGFELPGAFNTRNGPFFSLLPFVAGYYLSARTPAAGWMRTGLLVFAFGYVMHFAEIFALLKLYQTRAVIHDYVLATWLLGVGAAMMALSGHRLLQCPALAAAGRLTLGVYCIHIAFVMLLFPWFWPRTQPALELVLVAVILALSLAASWLLSKVPHLRRLVM
jgi:surface polysaccharide O-acyltransferase-like enzyme